MQITAGAVISDRFVVLGRIGAGAVAEVYLVKHLQLSSLHAIKVLQIPTPFVRARLLREGRLQSTLRDPHIVPVTDVVEIDGSPGLVMDFVRGPSLEKLLQHLRFDVDQAVAIGTGILLGMRAAHQAGMIHRDLKPANVLVEAGDAQLVPKVADFGLAKLLGSEEIPSGGISTATRTGSTLGTPAYMAPEQIRDARSVDERADVFALGTILYEILTGSRAFPGDDLLDLFDRIREGRYRPVRELLPSVPSHLEAAITRAIETERDRRLGSVAELLDLWTDGRGERAAEIDWPTEVLAIALSLVPDPQPAADTKPTSATFDLDGRPSEASATTVDHASSGETISPEQTAPGSASATTDTDGISLESPQLSPPAPAASAPHPYATAAVVLSFSLSLMLVCAGAISVVAVGLAIGWLQPGPKVPVHVADPRNGPLYSPHDLPEISSLPEVEQRHAAAWQAVRAGDLERALAELDTLADGTGEGDIGLRLLTAAAEIGLGEPAGYRRIEQAADAAKNRPGPLPDLARIASEAIRSGPDIERIRRHMKQWPEDELAVLLLARLDGLEGERKLELLNLARDQDPDAPGPALLLAQHWLDRANLEEAKALLDDAEARFPGDAEIAVARARWLLLSGRPAEARLAIERSDAHSPRALQIHASALRELGDIAALDSIHSRLPYGDHASRIAFARGRSEAAFGLGAVEESMLWLDRAFTAATRSGRLDDAAELARLHQQFAALLQRPSDLSTAIERARGAASMLGMPKGLHDRLTARILLLDGLLALEEDDLSRVQPNIERLEEADRGERLANILRSAQLAHQGERTSSADLPSGCAGRMIGAKWLARSESNEVDSIFSALSGPESPCARTGVDRYVRADAESYLALSAVARGDIEDAQRHIASSRALVPDATVDLPIFERNADAEERIATRDL